MHKNIQLCDDLSPEYLREITTFLSEWEDDSDHIIVSTSGSTGVPKQLKLLKNKVIASAYATGKFFNFKKGEKIILNLSPNYIAGKLIIVRALLHDMTLVVLPASQNPLLALAENSVIDFAAFVPYQVEAILRNPITRKKYEKIRNIIIGGAPIPSYLEADLATLRNANFATFGMTETVTHFALRNITKSETAYTCLPGFQVSVDEQNCLIIKKNTVTEELATTDVVDLVGGNKFEWKGRIDFVVNSGGVKLHPESIEQKIARYLVDRRFYCLGIPSDKFGQELIMVVEGEAIQDWDKAALIYYQELSKFEKPKRVVFMKQFKETKTGKVIRVNPLASYNDTLTEPDHN